MRTITMFSVVFGLLWMPCVWSAEPAGGTQVEQELKLADGQSIPYLLYLPKDYASGKDQWPLMLFLHGRGESYGPLSLVKKWGPPRMVEHGEAVPFIIVSPQCPGKESWAEPRQQTLLVALLDHLGKTYKVNADKASNNRAVAKSN